MITQGKETFQSPKALNPTTSVSDDSNEGEPVSPSLIAIGALDTFTNRKATTNESFTTFEDVSARSLNKEESGKYMIEDEKVILQEHVRNQRVFSKIAKEYQENQKHKKKRKKLQISVEYKKFPVQNTQRFSLIGNNEDELEESIHRLSLTCKNPINIIEDLNFEPVPFTPVVPASEEHIVNLELKQKLLLLESRNTQLEGSMESLKKEVKKANTKVEMLEFENMELAKQLEEFFSIPKVDVGTDPLEIFKEILKADQIIQMDPPTSTSVQIQTESTCWQQLIEKMKEELAAQAATLSSYEKSKAAMTLIIEKQQKTLDQYESEKMQSTKQKKTLISEITTLKTELERHRKYTLEVKELRQKVAQLQEENNQLQSLPAKLEHYENLSLEAGEKLREASLKLEEAKQESHKRAHKIKEVRKERDLLKIELLKLKQMFSEKYESYKEVKGRLYKKVKQKDETIDKLQKLLQGLDQIRNHSWKFEIEEDIQNERKRVSEEGRSKSFYSDETNPAYNSRHGISNNTNDSIVENDVVKKGPVDKYEYDQVKKSLQRGKYNNVSKMKNTSSINSDNQNQSCTTAETYNSVLFQRSSKCPIPFTKPPIVVSKLIEKLEPHLTASAVRRDFTPPLSRASIEKLTSQQNAKASPRLLGRPTYDSSFVDGTATQINSPECARNKAAKSREGIRNSLSGQVTPSRQYANIRHHVGCVEGRSASTVAGKAVKIGKKLPPSSKNIKPKAIKRNIVPRPEFINECE